MAEAAARVGHRGQAKPEAATGLGEREGGHAREKIESEGGVRSDRTGRVRPDQVHLTSGSSNKRKRKKKKREKEKIQNK